MIEEKVGFLNDKKEMLAGILRIPDPEKIFPAVIVCHDFMGNKDIPFIINLTNALSYFFITLRFDFRGNGESQGRFENTTITKYIKDLNSAVDYVSKLENVDKKNFCVIGHGLGGDAAILHSAKDKRIKALVTIGTRSNLDEFIGSYLNKNQINEWQQTGFTILFDRKINRIFLNDISKHNILEEVEKIKSPTLIINGTHDFRVPYSSARELFSKANEKSRFELIDGAGHDFRNQEKQEQLFNIIIDWLNRLFMRR